MVRRRFVVALVVAIGVGGCGAGGTVTAPSPSPTALARTTVQGTVWVANEGDGSLTAVDARTGTSSVTVEGVPSPHNVQASTDGRTVWAVTASDQLLSVSTQSLRLEHVAPTDMAPAHVVGVPGGGVVVTSSAQPSLYTYDGALRPVRRIPLTGKPHGVRLSEDGAVAVVANTGAGTLDVVDASLGAVRTRVRVGASPVQVAVSPDGAVGWVTLAGTGEVARVDLVGGRVTHRAKVPSAPAQLFLTSTGALLVANQGTDDQPGSTLSVLDAATLRESALVQVGSQPHGVVAHPGGRYAWVTNMGDGTVSTVDLSSATEVAVTPVGDHPNGVSWSPGATTSRTPRVALTVPQREDRAGHSHGGH